MTNKLLYSVLAISMLLFSSCANKEKIKGTPTPSGQGPGNKNILFTQTMTPGQVHNLIIEKYIEQYGIVSDNQITLAEVEIVCDRIAGIAEDENLLVNITATDLSDKMVEMYVESGAFVNGVLRPSDELTTMSINSVSNLDLRNAYSQIYNLAVLGGPNFVANSNVILNNLNSLTPEEQQEVNGFKSVMGFSFDLWSNPSYLPTPGTNNITRTVNADADGFRSGYTEGLLSSGGDPYFADFVGSAWGSSRSAMARIGL
jgi:hypothetical protein